MKLRLKIPSTIGLLLLMWLLLPYPASADQIFTWSFTSTNGGANGSGSLTATPDGGGVYTVDSITGYWGGTAITGVTSFSGNDELIYYPPTQVTGCPSFPTGNTGESAYLDFCGLSFALANGDTEVIWANVAVAGGYDALSGTQVLDSGDFTLATPEPATLCLMLMGLVALSAWGTMIKRKPLGQTQAP